MRWHLVYILIRPIFNKKDLKETPTDNRDIGQGISKHMFCNTCWNQSRLLANMLEQNLLIITLNQAITEKSQYI